MESYGPALRLQNSGCTAVETVRELLSPHHGCAEGRHYSEQRQETEPTSRGSPGRPLHRARPPNAKPSAAQTNAESHFLSTSGTFTGLLGGAEIRSASPPAARLSVSEGGGTDAGLAAERGLPPTRFYRVSRLR